MVCHIRYGLAGRYTASDLELVVSGNVKEGKGGSSCGLSQALTSEPNSSNNGTPASTTACIFGVSDKAP
ncbi:hypothetical protein CH35J_008948 [Colletotrichum higginsianum]|uniref:Uncharacterized protein n=1 Tax=Colletotrichum higginsianum TaxID=80884 RepID=A0A4T0VSK9_9PEZI|nr:hypothetical protein CH35J_008948 [Colletotrichum higginsianum]